MPRRQESREGPEQVVTTVDAARTAVQQAPVREDRLGVEAVDQEG